MSDSIVLLLSFLVCLGVLGVYAMDRFMHPDEAFLPTVKFKNKMDNVLFAKAIVEIEKWATELSPSEILGRPGRRLDLFKSTLLRERAAYLKADSDQDDGEDKYNALASEVFDYLRETGNAGTPKLLAAIYDKPGWQESRPEPREGE